MKAPARKISKKPNTETIKEENPIYTQPSTSSKIHGDHAYSRTRDETVKSIMPTNPQPLLNVHIPSGGSQTICDSRCMKVIEILTSKSICIT